MKDQNHRAPHVSLVIVTLMASALSGCTTAPQIPKKETAADSTGPEQPSETMVTGEWTIAIEPTADVLARAQFNTERTITLKTGAAQPEYNTVAKPFSQQEYVEYKAFWTEALSKPELQWRLVLKPDHSGQHFATDGNSNTPICEEVRWELVGDALQLVYPERCLHNTVTCPLLTPAELHYPMQPLGGWLVMRR